MERNKVLCGDILDMAATLEPGSVQTIATSPPYFNLRSYSVPPTAWPAMEYAPMPGLPPVAVPAQTVCLGAESDPLAFVGHLVLVFRALRPALRDDGVLWLNLGDSYAGKAGGWQGKNGQRATRTFTAAHIADKGGEGLTEKNLCGIPWRAAFALQADGWCLRSAIPWVKENSMPESAGDRPNGSVELVFLFSKTARYFFDMEAAKQCGALTRNWRNGDALLLLDCPTVPFSGVAHTSRLVAVSSGEPSDGTTRITSPDCPLHGDRVALPPRLSCGGRAGDSSSHTSRNGAGRAPTPPRAPAPTAHQSGPDSAVCSSDSPHPSCAPSATDHSSESRRTGRALAIAPHDAGSGETPSRTAHTLPSLERAAPHPGTRASSTALASLSCATSTETAAGTADIPEEHQSFAASDTSCTCQFYREITEKSSHFSTWPPELVRPMVRAGSSDYGACAACLAPYRRVVEREHTGQRNTFAGGNGQQEHRPGASHTLVALPAVTNGWQATCTCGPDSSVRPCLILDPFCGSGTTAAVAAEEGRDWLGIDADPRSVQWTQERIAAIPVGRLEAVAATAQAARQAALPLPAGVTP